MVSSLVGKVYMVTMLELFLVQMSVLEIELEPCLVDMYNLVLVSDMVKLLVLILEEMVYMVQG